MYNNECLEYIADKSYSEKYGARNMRRYIERNVSDKISDLIISNSGEKIIGISLGVQDDKILVNSI